MALSPVFLICATSVLLAVQFVWTVEIAYGTPYLLHHGLTKSETALVWLAGPLSGIIVQPAIGVYSDSIKSSSFGRRAPFIIFGTIFTVMSLVAFGWSSEKWSCVLAFYTLDFAINMVQGSSRTLLMDLPYPHEQERIAAFVTRMSNLGSVLGYLTAFIRWFPTDDPANPIVQVRTLCAMSSVVITLTSALSLVTIYYDTNAQSNNNPRQPQVQTTHRQQETLLQTFKNLSHNLKLVLLVQFISWFAWFPLLVYGTDWVNNHDTSIDVTSGAMGLLLFSIAGTISAVVAPRLSIEKQELWSMGHLLVTLIGIVAYFAKTKLQCLALLTLAGISWALNVWIPMTVLSEYVSTQVVESGEFVGGTLLGINNVLVVLPQFLSSGLNYIVFQLGGQTEHLFLIGSAVSICACLLSLRIDTSRPHDYESVVSLFDDENTSSTTPPSQEQM